MKIIALPSDETACAHYRVYGPLNEVKRQGLAEVEYLLPNPKNGEFQFTIHTPVPGMPTLSNYDIVVLNRNTNEGLYKVIDDAFGAGVKFVYDIDDDCFNVSPHSPSYVAWGRDKRRVMAMQQEMLKQGVNRFDLTPQQMAARARNNFDFIVNNIRNAPLVTVTTPALAELYAPYNKHIAVLPNQMIAADWENVERLPHDNLWIGWAGSGTHYEDLKEAAPGIIQAMLALPDATLVIAGFQMAEKVLFQELKGRVITYPWTDINSYRKYVASFDIVLAPSAPTKFNQAKSDIRVLEAGMLSKPVVASETTYGYTVRVSQGGLVAERAKDWSRAILQLAGSAQMRAELGGRLHNYSRHRTYVNTAQQWVDAYTELLNDQSNYHRRIYPVRR